MKATTATKKEMIADEAELAKRDMSGLLVKSKLMS